MNENEIAMMLGYTSKTEVERIVQGLQMAQASSGSVSQSVAEQYRKLANDEAQLRGLLSGLTSDHALAAQMGSASAIAEAISARAAAVAHMTGMHSGSIADVVGQIGLDTSGLDPSAGAIKAFHEAQQLQSSLFSNQSTITEAYRRLIEDESSTRKRTLELFSGPRSDSFAERFGGFGAAGETERLRELLRTVDMPAAKIVAQFEQERLGSALKAFELQHDALRSAVFGSTAVERAKELAFAAQGIALDGVLDDQRTSVGPLTDKMLYLGSLDSIRSPDTLRAFVEASAVSDVLNSSFGFGTQAQRSLEAMAARTIPEFGSVQEYGRILKAAGLDLPRWPQRRLRTIGERRNQVRHRLASVERSSHAKKGWTMFEQYEQVLRQFIDDAMTQHYGEDWPHERLPACDCKKLLRKWELEGGEPLDHADFAHYRNIMCDSEHYELIFSKGFGDRDALDALLGAARELRAKVMHFRGFTAEDLRDLRLTWKAIEAGWVGLTHEYEYVFH